MVSNLLLDFVANVGMGAQHFLRSLTALAQTIFAIGVPSAALFHHASFDAHIYNAALTRDALAIHDVELGLPKRRRNLVLHHLGAHAVAHRIVGLILERFDSTNVDANAREELKGAAARRGFGIAEHHADFFTQLIDEDARGI